MSTHERARLRPVKRLSETAAAHAETHHEPRHQCGPLPLPVGHEHFEHFQIPLSAAQADHLRALADSQRTIAVDLIQQWVSEQLDQQDIPDDPFSGQHYPPNVIRLPYFR